MPMIGGSLHQIDGDRRCFTYCGDERCVCEARPDLMRLLSRPEVPAEELDRPRFFPSRVGRTE